MRFYRNKKTTKPVKIKFKTKSGDDVELTATRITTKRVPIKFSKTDK